MHDKFNPKASIIIPVFNGGDYLREAIDSAINQTYQNKEIIVVNDGSNDDGRTDAIARSYNDKIVYLEKSNGGVASALNLGIANMKGDYFSWLSHDDTYYPEKLSSQIEYLSSLEDPTAIIICGFAIIDKNGNTIHCVNPRKTFTQEQLRVPLFALLHGQVNGCCLLIHKSHFHKAGLFDERLLRTQDFDLWFKMMRDARVECHENVLCGIRTHGGQGSKRHIDEFADEGNMLWIGIMRQLSDFEKKRIDVTTSNFYKNIYNQLVKYTPYKQAAIYARDRGIIALRGDSGNVAGVRMTIKEIMFKYSVYASLLADFAKSLMQAGFANTIKRTVYALRRLANRK
jgi:glycosyltransferase involved in cell wall biosynthesis